MNQKEICGTCKWHQHEDIDDGWVCVNGDSEYVTDWTDYDFGCDAWEGRQRAIGDQFDIVYVDKEDDEE